jgi:hypothetical protein
MLTALPVAHFIEWPTFTEKSYLTPANCKGFRSSLSSTRPRILYFMLVYKREAQIERIVKRMQHEGHSFVLHLDQKVSPSFQKWAVEYATSKGNDNVCVIKSDRVVWRTASDLRILAKAMSWASSIGMGGGKWWDYFVPLDGASYPLMTSETLLQQLTSAKFKGKTWCGPIPFEARGEPYCNNNRDRFFNFVPTCEGIGAIRQQHTEEGAMTCVIKRDRDWLYRPPYGRTNKSCPMSLPMSDGVFFTKEAVSEQILACSVAVPGSTPSSPHPDTPLRFLAVSFVGQLCAARPPRCQGLLFLPQLLHRRSGALLRLRSADVCG